MSAYYSRCLNFFFFFFTPFTNKREKQKERMFLLHLICLIKANTMLLLLLLVATEWKTEWIISASLFTVNGPQAVEHNSPLELKLPFMLWWPGIRCGTFQRLYYSSLCTWWLPEHGFFMAYFLDSNPGRFSLHHSNDCEGDSFPKTLEIWIVSDIPAIRYVINWINCLTQCLGLWAQDPTYKANGAFHNAIENLV